jgi:hypothetical protein
VRAALAVSILLAGSAAPLSAGIEVTQAAGRISIRADRAAVSEVLERVSERTAMRVVYDGDPPPLMLTLTLTNLTPVDAVAGLLEGLAVKYAMVLDESGTQVRVLLITTAPVPQSAYVAEPVAVASEEPVVVVRPPDRPEPATVAVAPPVSPVGPVPVQVAVPAVAPPAYASYAGPFTPQGPGPVVLPPPGVAAAPAAAPVPAATPMPAIEPLGLSSAALPPWMKAGYGGN